MPICKFTILLSTVLVLGACQKKNSHKESPSAPPPPTAPSEPSKKEPSPPQAPQTPPEAKQPQQSQSGQTEPTASNNNEHATTPPAVANPPSTKSPQADLPSPAEKSPSQPMIDSKSPSAENSLPDISPLDTFGGQLIQAYLANEITGEQVISQVFDNRSLVMSNLAEISVGIRGLRDKGAYSPADQEKVLVLEGAMTQYLNEKIRSDKKMTAALEYGTAAALGLVGGIYSNEIIQALERLSRAPIVSAPLKGLYSIYESAKGSPEAISNWLKQTFSRRPSSTASTPPPSTGSAAAVGAEDVEEAAVRETVDRSRDLYLRTLGYFRSADPAQRELHVFNNIYRVINSPQLAKGYSVTRLPAEEIGQFENLRYFKTGIPGFQISTPQEGDRLVAKMVVRGGEYEYYRVQGEGVRILSRDGDEIVIPPSQMTEIIANRMQRWGERTTALLNSTWQRAKTRTQQSVPYQYVTTDPFGRRLAQGAAVGLPISALTLMTLKPIDTSYLTLDDYVRELETEGVDLGRFVDRQRRKASAGRM